MRTKKSRELQKILTINFENGIIPLIMQKNPKMESDAMFFSKSYEVKYSDMDSLGNLKLSAILEFLQDISIKHAETSKECCMESLSKNHLAWLICQWNIRLEEEVLKPRQVEVETCVYSFGMTKSKRQYRIKVNGRVIVSAVAEWFLFNFELGKPVKINDYITDYFPACENVINLDTERIERREATEEESFRVLKKDIDTNVHLNNVRSFDYTCEALDNGFRPKKVTVSYKHSAYLGDKTKLYKYEDEKEIVSCLKLEEKDIIVTKFTK